MENPSAYRRSKSSLILLAAIVAALIGITLLWQGSVALGQDNDKSTLEALYRATGGDNWRNNDNWLSESPIGDWYGRHHRRRRPRHGAVSDK